MKNTDFKNTLSTIFGILAAICGGLITAIQGGLVLPAWVLPAATGLGAISVAIIGFLTGKNPDLSTKTPLQIDKQIEEKETTKEAW